MNANYFRKLPRDLFNEAKLLKCIGRLVLLIHDNQAINGMKFRELVEGAPFDNDLTNDGYLYIRSIEFYIGETILYFKTQYNAKSNYPLYLEYDLTNTDIPVFDDEGNYTKEFIEVVNTIKE